MTIIGQIAIKNVKNLVEIKADPGCLTLESYHNKWDMCAASLVEMQEWYCSIKYAMRDPCDGAKSGNNNSKKNPLSDLVGH